MRARRCIVVLLLGIATGWNPEAAPSGSPDQADELLGPSAYEVKTLGKRLESVADVESIGLVPFNLSAAALQYANAGQPAEAVRVAEIGIQWMRRSETSPDYIRALRLILARALAELGKTADAESTLLELLNAAEGEPYPAERANLFLELASFYREQGLFQRAIEITENARRLIESDLLPPKVRDGSIYSRSEPESGAESDAVLKELTEVAALVGKDELTDEEERRLAELGDRNERRLKEMIRQGEIDSLRSLHIKVYWTKAQVMLSANEPLNAAQSLDRYLDLKRQYHLDLAAGELIERARIASIVGDPVAARRLYEAAHPIAKSDIGAGGMREPLQFPVDRMVIERVLGRSSESLVFARSANALAEVYEGLARDGEARPLLEQARAAIENVVGRNNSQHANQLRRIAELDERAGQYQAALSAIREATIVFQEASPANAATISRRLENFGAASRTYETHLSLLASLLNGDPADEEVVAEAVQVIQSATISQAGAAISARDLRPQDARVADLVRKYQDAEANVATIERALLVAMGAGSARNAQILELRVRRDASRAERGRALANLRAAAPRTVELLSLERLSLRDIRQRLGDTDALVILFVGERRSFSMRVGKTGAHLEEVGASRLIVEQLVRRLRESLDPVSYRGSGRLPEYDFESALRLNDLFFEPLFRDGDPRPDHLLIVASTPLDSIPFSALVRSIPKTKNFNARHRTADYLLNSFAMTTLPAVSNLAPERPESINSATTAAIAFADPIVSGLGHWQRGSLLALLPATKPQDPMPPGSTAFSVPGAQEEVAEIFEVLGAKSETAFIGRRATEAKVRAIDLTPFRVVLFATHALTANEAPRINEPALILTPPAIVNASEDDGLLAASEIARMRVGPGLIILSACSTASSDGTLGAEAMSGLASAFLFAGARELLITHWAVGSLEAPRITVPMIRKMRAGQRGATALQSAMKEMIASPRYPEDAHPTHWAPFILVGG